jgi:hypothetical protein
MDGWHMTGPAGSYYVIGYGGELRIPTLDFVAGEKNIVGNIVGTYTDLAELMVLAQAGKVSLHTQQYPPRQGRGRARDLDGGKVRGRAISYPERGPPPPPRRRTPPPLKDLAPPPLASSRGTLQVGRQGSGRGRATFVSSISTASSIDFR